MKRSFLVLLIFLTAAIIILSRYQSPDSLQSSRLHIIDPKTPGELQELFRYTADPLPLVSAHRGGPRKNFPENCLETFQHTIESTYAMLEVDPRYTKDSLIVLHHDDTLERTTDGNGKLSECTLKELKRLRLKDPEGNLTEFVIPTLDEVLEWARGKTILLLDQKDVPLLKRIRKIEEHQAEAYAYLIVYSFEDAKFCYQLNKNILMEVFIPSQEKFIEFDLTGIPWSNIVAFVGHTPPQDSKLYEKIHSKGSSCIVGSSRNIDRQLINGDVPSIQVLGKDYLALLDIGADIIETDLPIEVGELLYKNLPVPSSKVKFFN
jgi:glycerophosphoryl diester phosphodiesterase